MLGSRSLLNFEYEIACVLWFHTDGSINKWYLPDYLNAKLMAYSLI